MQKTDMSSNCIILQDCKCPEYTAHEETGNNPGRKIGGQERHVDEGIEGDPLIGVLSELHSLLKKLTNLDVESAQRKEDDVISSENIDVNGESNPNGNDERTNGENKIEENVKAPEVERDTGIVASKTVAKKDSLRSSKEEIKDNVNDDVVPVVDVVNTKITEDDVDAGEKYAKDNNSKQNMTDSLIQIKKKRKKKQEFINTIVNKMRQNIAHDMKDYSYHHKLKNKKIDDLILEKGGRPVRSVVITTWRSGSTFIGDVLQSHPATYYHYEPLLDFDIKRARHGVLAEKALHNLRRLMTCNYTDMEHYLTYGRTHQWLFLHNRRLWTYCAKYPKLCSDPDFLSPFCSLFPFQSLKTVRLRLNLTREFLEDKTLGVQVLLLVRDPRGTMQSRKHRVWCPGNPDCEDPAILCDDLINDYNTAIDFRRKYPSSFRVVRYEDLSFDAYNMTKELFDFFHLNYHPHVQQFLDTHTKKSIGGVSSTFRDSKTAPIHWKKELSWSDVQEIQKVCSKALKLWGYEIAKDEKHLQSFMPVGTFRFR